MGKRLFWVYIAKSKKRALELAFKDWEHCIDYAKCVKTFKSGLKKYKVYITSL